MNPQRGKGGGGTFHDDRIPFHQIQYVQVPHRIVRHGFGEPMAPSLKEFQLVQASAFLAPAIPAGHLF